MPQTRSKLLAAVAVSAAALVATPAATAVPAGSAAPARPTRPATTKPDQYSANAVATALRVSIFGQGLSIGSASASVDSKPTAHAEGHGALLATQSFGASTASAARVGQSTGGDTPSCSPLVLPQAVPLLQLSAACSTSKAAVTSSGPASSATGKSIDISLSGNAALSAIPTSTLTTQLTDTLIGALPPLTGVFPVPTSVVVDQLGQLLNNAITGNGVKLLTVEGGSAAATTSSDGDSVDAATTSAGATIKLLDRSGLGLAPILTITVGQSTTSVSRVRATGATTATETAIPVTVAVAPDVAFLLKLPQSTFEAPEGKQIDLPLPAPLTSSIKLSGGSTGDITNGKQAQSGSLEIDLLQGLMGGIDIGLSTGSSAVAGTVATKVADKAAPTPAPTVPPSTPAVAPTSLPRTGVEENDLLLMALVLALAAIGTGALVWTASRRSRAAATGARS